MSDPSFFNPRDVVTNDKKTGADRWPRLVAQRDPPLRMLVVGARTLPAGLADDLVRDPTLRFAEFAEIGGALIDLVQPDIVISMLIGAGFDAIDLAIRLQDAGFLGPYRAVSTGVENVGSVRSEVQSAVPALDFDIFQLDPS